MRCEALPKAARLRGCEAVRLVSCKACAVRGRLNRICGCGERLGDACHWFSDTGSRYVSGSTLLLYRRCKSMVQTKFGSGRAAVSKIK